MSLPRSSCKKLLQTQIIVYIPQQTYGAALFHSCLQHRETYHECMNHLGLSLSPRQSNQALPRIGLLLLVLSAHKGRHHPRQKGCLSVSNVKAGSFLLSSLSSQHKVSQITMCRDSKVVGARAVITRSGAPLPAATNVAPAMHGLKRKRDDQYLSSRKGT